MMPVMYDFTLMSVACGKNDHETGLDGQVIEAKQPKEIASKQAVPHYRGRNNPNLNPPFRGAIYFGRYLRVELNQLQKRQVDRGINRLPTGAANC